MSGSSPSSSPSSDADQAGTDPVGVDPATVDLRNRLGDETSPYLLQHKNNPVHWFAWGPEAFEAARLLNRPIFLSVGYSTCYWCHVMERESFENEAIAAIMNEHFVCIKVDREERPDVDDIYMAAVQLTNRGQGGWPMSVFIEPNGLKPFLGGTYFPPTDSAGRPGFPTVLRQIADFWKNQRENVIKQADAVAAAITQQMTASSAPVPINSRDVERGITHLLTSYDKQDGGFVGSPQRAPKFPIPSTLEFLMGAGWDVEPVRRALIHTLDRMATGGMYDQIGGGFHRYSTDEKWLVPHFEKMLYDNGQLASLYAEAYERTGDEYYAQIVRETLDYVVREMTASGGGFFSAQDAEVNHREGQNYVWTPEQIRVSLTEAGLEEEIDLVLEAYGFNRGTNFQDPHHREDPPTNVVFLIDRPDVVAEQMNLSLDTFNSRLAAANAVLLATRDTRDQPITDDKILTGWNGLMIAGFADGGRCLNEDKYRRVASDAADYILTNMRASDGSLLRTARDGKVKIEGFIEDYSLMIYGLTALYRATLESKYLESAVEMAAVARDRFWDDSAGGYFDTLAGQDDLFVRSKSTYDGAVPCGNSAMAYNLIALGEITGDQAYLDDAATTLGNVSEVLTTRPTSAVMAALALHRMATDHPEKIGAEPATAAASPFDKVEPVQIAVSTTSVRLASGGSAEFEVTLTIAKGYHVNAHRPGIEYLIPLKIDVVGASGVELDVSYPEGEPYSGPEGQMIVHHKTVKIPVTARRTGTVNGRPQVMITFQVCDDQVCLAPETKRVPIGIIAE